MLDLNVNYNDYLIGRYHIAGENKIEGPLDFSLKNFMSIEEQHAFLKQVMFPESVPKDKRLALSDEDYYLLYREMSILPRQSNYPKYKALTTMAIASSLCTVTIGIKFLST